MSAIINPQIDERFTDLIKILDERSLGFWTQKAILSEVTRMLEKTWQKDKQEMSPLN